MNEMHSIPANLAPPVPLSVDAAKHASSTTILLVEDEPLVREAASDILEYQGYQVLKARNAQEARTTFYDCAVSIGLLITDVVLPGQNGLALAEELRAICPTLPAILVSGFPENAVTQKGMSFRQMQYLPKPFSAEMLVRAVKRALAAGRDEVPV